MLQKKTGGLYLYNPLNKNYLIDLEWYDGIISIFNYSTGKYILEWKYK